MKKFKFQFRWEFWVLVRQSPFHNFPKPLLLALKLRVSDWLKYRLAKNASVIFEHKVLIFK